MPPQTLPPSKCNAAEGEQPKGEDEAPTCCWHHYMEYWLQRVQDEEGGQPAPAGGDRPDKAS